MTSPLDFVSWGLSQASGLSLTTGGLLVLLDAGEGAAPGELAVPPKIDVQLIFDPLESVLDGDLAIENGDLVIENSLGTALLLSLFTDARASDEELARFGGDDPRGWWGDALATFERDRFGSKLWLLQRETQTTATLAKAKAYAEEALAWLITDGICDAVNVTALYPQRSLLGLVVDPVQARSVRQRFAFVWEV